MSTERRRAPARATVFTAVFAAVALSGAAVPAAAQSGARELIRQRTGQEVTRAQILERLERSGLTRSQVRNRLLGMGLDPALADPYFDRLEGEEGAELPDPDAGFVGALSRMGLLGEAAAGVDSAMGLDPTSRDTALGPRPDSMAAEGDLPVFGKAVFARRTSQFRPLLTGPVPPDYRLGPGDEISLVLTGDVELAYTLPVSREGTVVIPDVGQVSVNGITMAQLEDRLYDRLGQVFSGVQRGPGASTRFQVSLGRLRMNEVFVIGEVEYPGAYEVSSLATSLGALYQAGGPTPEGSFRRVQVRRGGEEVARIDLYDYLLAADTRADVRLEHGDIVFVPLAGPQVRVEGEVPRNAVFELQEDESLADVVAFAGDPAPTADLDRVRIQRILPPGERTPGRERVLVDVDLPGVRSSGGVVPLRDGDEVRIPPIGLEQKDRVVLAGSVFRPGPFELESGMTVWDLVRRGGGLRPEAFEPVAHVTRLQPADSSYVLRRVSLETDGAGNPVDNLPLQDQDSVTVFARATLETPRHVSIEGEVKEPGRFVLADSMTVEDLVLSAGGFTERALGVEVEVARLEPGFQRRDTVATTFSVSMRGTIPWSVLGRDLVAADGDGLQAAPRATADEVVLLEGDRVIVRPLPGFVEEATVEARGEVTSPGSYALLAREERVSSLLRRSGGPTDGAYVRGAHLVRDSTLVGIDLEEILRRPGSEADIVLRPGDILRVPLYEGTVLVRGAVAFETRIVYDEDLGFEDYVRRAGGATAESDMGRANILYPNGRREVVSDVLWLFTDHPDVEPGSTITVPFRREAGATDWNTVVTQGLGILGSIATLIVAISR